MTRALGIAVIAAVMIGGPSAARADDDAPRTAVSIQVPALTASALSAQAERDLGSHRLSLAAGVSVRASAMGDYDSLTVGGGVELRRWLGRAPGITGWYAALRVDIGHTTLAMESEDRTIGSLVTVAAGPMVGHRWLLWRHVELTPYAGLAVVTEAGLDGRLPRATRGAGLAGVTLGWMF